MKRIHEIMSYLYTTCSNIASLSKRIGISKSTVGRLLKRDMRPIHEATREKILDYYEYVLNHQGDKGQSLKIGQSYKIKYDSGPKKKYGSDSIQGKVVEDYPRFYVIQCKHYKQCFNKANLLLKSTYVAKI